MLRKLYATIVRFPKVSLTTVVLVTVFFALQLHKLRWETDARVYLPKGHPAIIYDEKIDEVFGVKDAVIIGIVNDKGIFNPTTLARIKRMTEKVAALPGVIANRTIDVVSLSTASYFVGTETEMGSKRLMVDVPTDPQEIEQIKKSVYDNADLFVGNIVSADGKAAMIRARLKEGITNRYKTYFQIKGIIGAEMGGGGGGGWNGGGGNWGKEGGWQQQGQWSATQGGWTATADNGDRFYLAGRPVIEVTSGLNAVQDMQIMVPMLILAMAIVLFIIFRTLRGVLLPLFVMAAAIIWTMGAMAVLDIPLYTISTMLPVILVAVGIGDGVHLMSHYYDNVLSDPYRNSKDIVLEVTQSLGPPLVITSVTTAIGFLSLWFAEMPPFKVFGLFTVLGIFFCWLLSVAIIPAALSLMQPKVGGYLAKRRAMRLYSEPGRISHVLVRCGAWLGRNSRPGMVVLGLIVVVSVLGARSLYVDSSWMSDFRKDSEINIANDMFNDKFDGTIFLNVVIEGRDPNTVKSPEVLEKIAALQDYIEKQPYVGDSLSIVDYLKSINKNLHAGDPAYEVLPKDRAQIAEYLFLFSVSGRPEQLDEVVDYNYRQTNVTFSIKTDHTKVLKKIVDQVKGFVNREFKGLTVSVNYAGSANNSYVWAGLLIDSQTKAIVLSKIGIFLLATILFRSFSAGLYVIVPVSFATLIIAGVAGFLQIPLDVSTALAAGVAIGVGVDYAVHFIFRYRQEFERLASAPEAIAATMRSVGKTIFFNAAVVTIGFLVLLASQFPPHVKMGWFVSAYMVISCIAALIVLPLLISFFNRGKAEVHAPQTQATS